LTEKGQHEHSPDHDRMTHVDLVRQQRFEQFYRSIIAVQRDGSTRAMYIKGIKGVGRSIGVDMYFCPQGEK